MQEKGPQVIKCGMRPLAHQRGFEPPTYRLGGGRSILLSYWCSYPYILPKFFLSVKKIRHFFYSGKHILSGSFDKEAKNMYTSDDPCADLDDLIFEKGAGGPSDR